MLSGNHEEGNSKNSGAVNQVSQSYIWEKYNKYKVEGKNVANQTALFFEAIPSTLKDEFISSSEKNIVQMGVSTGTYLGECFFPGKRKVIGYDYADSAISYINKTGEIDGRQVDLNSTKLNERENTLSLTYQHLLENDLSQPSDVLMIRILEYLNPEAVVLLIHSMLTLAKSGTNFYFEIFNANDDEKNSQLRFGRYIQPGYVPSFFGPRTDFSFRLHTVNKDEENDKCSGNGTLVERFIVNKR